MVSPFAAVVSADAAVVEAAVVVAGVSDEPQATSADAVITAARSTETDFFIFSSLMKILFASS